MQAYLNDCVQTTEEIKPVYIEVKVIRTKNKTGNSENTKYELEETDIILDTNQDF